MTIVWNSAVSTRAKVAAAGAFLLALSPFIITGAAAQAQAPRLANIFDAAGPLQRHDDISRFSGCPRPPAVITDHQAVNVYADVAGQTIAGDRWVRQARGTRSLRDFSAFVASMADGALLAKDRREARAACAAQWLESWARGRAFLGDMQPAARYDTIWFGQVGLGVSYLKIKDSPAVTAAQRQVISSWLSDVARAAVRDEATLIASDGQLAAHPAWTVAALAVAGVAANDRDLFDRAMAGARRMLGEVSDIGALPSELARGRRAFQNHVWAFEPLALTALIGRRNGVSLDAENNHALRRVAGFIIASARGEARIADLAKFAQDGGISAWPRSFEAGALEIFSALERVPEVEEILRTRRPAASPFTGGDWSRTLPRR